MLRAGRLYSELERRAASGSTDSQDWLLTGALYRGDPCLGDCAEKLSFAELKITYDLRVFGRQVRVRIPLGHEGVRMAPGGAVLEGRAIGLTWPASGGDLEFEVADPGQYRLELSLAPDVQSRDGITTFDLRIPRLATSRLELAAPGDAPAVEVPLAAGSVSRLELAAPGDAPAVEVPLAAGSVTRDAEPPRVVAQLGPADRLRIRWPEGAERSTGNPAIDVEELLWLKINPGAAVLETLLKFKAVRGHARQVRLAVDPHLQLLPSTSDGSWVAQHGNGGRSVATAHVPTRASVHRFVRVAGGLSDDG